jgi:tetratricopeptide (TPR) repeat protein
VLLCKTTTIRPASVFRPGVLLALALFATGCSELQARRHARAGNGRYLEGDYAGALHEYEIADQTHPGLFVVALNKGLACRQLMVPGSKSHEQEKAVDCALDSFKRMKELQPADPRGDQLYVQTLFDGDRFDALNAMYEAQLQQKPNDLAAINGLISVNSRADRWGKALEWTIKRADVDTKDAEAQYAVGVMIFNRLFQKGGADKGNYNPWPDPNIDPKAKGKGKGKDKAKDLKQPPPFTMGDVMGAERVRLSDLGISYLNRALEVRPDYREAIAYMVLLYRQKAYAFLEKPEEWQACIDQSDQWKAKAAAAAPAAQATPT